MLQSIRLYLVKKSLESIVFIFGILQQMVSVISSSQLPKLLFFILKMYTQTRLIRRKNTPEIL